MDKTSSDASALAVDLSARRRLAELVVHLASGTLDTDTFTCRGAAVNDSSADPGVHAVYQAAWGLYSDLRSSYRLRGRHALPPASRHWVAICVLFLKSEQPYAASALVPVEGSRGGRDALLLILTAILLFSPIFLFVLSIPLALCSLLAGFGIWALAGAQERARAAAALASIPAAPVWPFDSRAALEAARHSPGTRYLDKAI